MENQKKMMEDKRVTSRVLVAMAKKYGTYWRKMPRRQEEKRCKGKLREGRSAFLSARQLEGGGRPFFVDDTE